MSEDSDAVASTYRLRARSKRHSCINSGSMLLTLNSSSVSDRAVPNIHTRLRQRMKCEPQPAVRQTEGLRLTHHRVRRNRQLGPTLESRFTVIRSLHPHGHLKTAHRGMDRLTIATQLVASAAHLARSKSRTETTLAYRSMRCENARSRPGSLGKVRATRRRP